MHIGLNTSTTTASHSQSAVERSQAPARLAPVAHEAQPTSFPEHALLSRRPVRYNIQLNQQLTTLQQADKYLADTETLLLNYRHQGSKRGDTRALQQHIHQRAALSGGTIDRQLTATLQHTARISFTVPESGALLNNPQGETLLFALGEGKAQLAAVTLPPQATQAQTLAHLNTALGKFGIHAQATDGQCRFQVDESRWEAVSQSLRVRGEGKRFAQDAWTVLNARAEQDPVSRLQQLVEKPEKGALARLEKVIDHISHQRIQLRKHHTRVTARIDDMATGLTRPQALATAETLGRRLAEGNKNYRSMAESLTAQANIHLATVKNILR